MFHKIHLNTDKPKKLNSPFFYEPCELSLYAVNELQKHLPKTPKEGKMWGVLVVEHNGETGFIHAYSGQLTDPSTLPEKGWEGCNAVFNYTQEGGYFKGHESEISSINKAIIELENSSQLKELRQKLEKQNREATSETEKHKRRMVAAKMLRDKKRKESHLSGTELQALIQESQFLKAELHRKKIYYRDLTDKTKHDIIEIENRINQLKSQRKQMSDSLQRWLFSKFVMRNGLGEEKNLLDIFHDYYAETDTKIPVDTLPPSGAGECCEPKMLQTAYKLGMHPMAMAMFWWGPSPKTEIRHHRHFYPACNGKCRPILHWMLKGLEVEEEKLQNDEHLTLEIVYEDDHLAVINKPSGMLSVPGKGKRESVFSLLKERWQGRNEPFMVHRLDMATSGLLLVAKDERTQKSFQKEFREHRVEKRYIAVVCPQSGYIPDEGTIDLPLNADIMDRPRQKIDYQNGKRAITRYKVVERKNGEVLLQLWLETGRTHQLRVHCASPDGLNAPIKGDTLYGKAADRLYLHAEYIRILDKEHNKYLSYYHPYKHS